MDYDRGTDRNIEDTGKLLTKSAAESGKVLNGLMIGAVAVALVLICAGVFLIVTNIGA